MAEDKKLIQHEIHDEMKNSYIDYAMSVIVGRALPDVRDGLKPVHRRILYGMSSLGITPEKPHKKSARIVGEVMGKYHPHGDCLDEDTVVIMADRRIKRIKELYEEGVPAEILTYDEEIDAITHATAHDFRIGQYADTIYEIRLHNDYTIKSTGNHPFLLIDANWEHVWVKAENIKPGDKLFTHHEQVCQEERRIATVESVEVIHLEEKIPMYDFTVDKYHNMLICANGYNDMFVVAHNSSIYQSMVNMAQPFNMRYPLVDGHGNFGSIDGDGAAASRYTEARMSPFSLQMIRDIDKDTVDFIPNFDEEEMEPVVLPSRVPNLLINGSNGIAVGMATSIPPHNLGEVIDACVQLIDKPKRTKIDDILKIIKGPDFPTGAHILGHGDIEEAYRTGRGKVQIRSVAEIEEGARGKYQIVVSEIPYQINKAKMLEKIGELVKDKKLDGISAIRDESNRKGMRIVIELKRDANPNVMLNKLFKMSQLQCSYSIIMLALVDGKPKILNILEILQEYIKHQKEVVTRRTRYELAKAEARAHILEGYIIALDNIEEVIKTIRSSRDDAKEKLMKRFGLSEIQAQAILDMRLARLQGLEREKIENEYKEICEKIAYLKSILADEKKLMKVIKKELLEIKKKWADERRTKIVADPGEIDIEDLIEDEQVAVTLTHLGYLKRVPADTYKTQARGGKGIKGVTTRENDFIKNLFLCSSHDNLLFFTNRGRVYKLKAYEIPEANRTAKGTPAVNFLNLMQNERINAVISLKDFPEDEYLMAITKNGTVKKTSLSELKNVRKNGLNAINLVDGDELVSIQKTSGDDKVVIITKMGMCICFSEKDVRPTGRGAIGVKAIMLDDDDSVVSMSLAQDGEELLVVTSKGFGKRTPVEEYRMQKRGGKGMATYDKKQFPKTGTLVGAEIISNDDELILINSDGIVIRIKVKGIRKTARSTKGVKIMKTDENVDIISLSKLICHED